jgi:hypothetical protein
MIIVLAGTAAIVLGTWLGAPLLAPILVGAVIGLGWPALAVRRSAIAGVLAWGGLLLVALARGDALGAFSRTLGDAMAVPPWALFVVTLLYPAILASSAAWLAHLVSPRRSTTIDPGATVRARHPTT